MPLLLFNEQDTICNAKALLDSSYGIPTQVGCSSLCEVSWIVLGKLPGSVSDCFAFLFGHEPARDCHMGLTGRLEQMRTLQDTKTHQDTLERQFESSLGN